MSRLPRVRANEVIRALRRAGFQVARTKGSHHILMHPDGRRTVVPVHANLANLDNLYRLQGSPLAHPRLWGM